jgi:outer membrane protein TolC
MRDAWRARKAISGFLSLALTVLVLDRPAAAQSLEALPPPAPLAVLGQPVPTEAPGAPTIDLPNVPAGERALPINLPTALRLAGARPLDIALASERIRLAAAELQRAQVLWLPTIYLGGDYFRHDGQLQDVTGNVFGTSKSSVLLGAGPYAVFAISDAIFAPLAARQTVQARQAALQAAANDSLLVVAEAYFNVQQARGDLAGAQDAARRAEAVLRQTEALAKGFVPPVEVSRARVEVSRRRQLVRAAQERWQTASADLARVLRLDAAAIVEPLEPPHLLMTLVPPERTADELIPLALLNRPELAENQALVRATLERLRQEKLRPLIPSVLLRGASTPVVGTLAGGYFGGGTNSTLSNFGARGDFDVQLLWTFENGGLGNVARIKERRAENAIAALQLFRVQDQVAKEVVQALAQVKSAGTRLGDAEREVKDAIQSAEDNVKGLRGTKGAADQTVLLVRPQEAVQSVQALAQAYADYYAAVADYDRAQFRLYRALGRPAQGLTCDSAHGLGNTSLEPLPLPASGPSARIPECR